MIKSEEKLKKLKELLDKGNPKSICKAVGLLRNEPSFEGAIGLVVSFYNESDDLPVKTAIAEFLNDLKDQSAAPEVISELRKVWKDETVSMLVASCWQSGLDYSQYSRDFAEMFLKADYITAIECLTVIEEAAGELSSTEKEEIIELLDNNPFARSNEKEQLKIEFLSILKR